MNLPTELMHWIPTPILALGFWWLLKRTFNDFEHKLAGLFKSMENTLSQQQAHDKTLALLEQRVEALESKKRR